MKTLVAFILATAVAVIATATEPTTAANPTTTPACVLETQLDSIIGPSTLDLIRRGKSRAEAHHCGAVLLLINTPGGNLQTTRYIVEEILSSPVPFLCLVYPSGGRAGSAGAIILESCHLSGAVSATNIGAATPVDESGKNIPSDLREKIINDTKSWVVSLAKLRGRNEKFAEDMIVKAKAVSGEEAAQLKAIEFSGESKSEFLKFAEGRTVKMGQNQNALKLSLGSVVPFEHDLRYRVMDLLMNPEVAYLMFMASLGLLYFETTHPGMIAPGVIGGFGLIISLISLHFLDVTWGAVLLILFGIGLLIAEAFIGSFGVIGLGGVIAFFVGSLFLFDFETTGYSLSLSVILPTVILLGVLLLFIAYLAFSYRKKRKHAGFDVVVGAQGKITEVQEGDGRYGYVEVASELWRCTSNEPMRVGEVVKIIGHQGFTLNVQKAGG